MPKLNSGQFMILAAGLGLMIVLLCIIFTTHRSTMFCAELAGEMRSGSCWINR